MGFSEEGSAIPAGFESFSLAPLKNNLKCLAVAVLEQFYFQKFYQGFTSYHQHHVHRKDGKWLQKISLNLYTCTAFAIQLLIHHHTKREKKGLVLPNSFTALPKFV